MKREREEASVINRGAMQVSTLDCSLRDKLARTAFFCIFVPSTLIGKSNWLPGNLLVITLAGFVKAGTASIGNSCSRWGETGSAKCITQHVIDELKTG